MKPKHAIQQRLGRRRTPRDVNINRYNSVHPSYDTVAIMVVSSSVGATTHADHPFWIRHLVVAQPHSRGHLVGDRACHNHHVGLAWRGSEEYAETVLIVSGHGGVHHLDATAGQRKG